MHYDKLKTRPVTKKYSEGWNRIFGKKGKNSKDKTAALPKDRRERIQVDAGRLIANENKAPNVTDVRGPTPAFYMHHKSTPPTFHHDSRKRDAPRFSNEKWAPYFSKSLDS